MNQYEFKTHLLTTGQYITNVKKNASLLPTLFFYIKIFATVWRASKKARKKIFDINKDWSQASIETIQHCEAVGGQFDIQGLKNLRAIGPAVYIGNHMSTLENFTLPIIIGTFTPLTFVVKKELLTFPIFGHIMKEVQPISLNRKDPKLDLEKVLMEGKNILQSGKSIVIFPQSTRLDEVKAEDFNSLGTKLASQAKAPLIPFAVKTKFWGNNKIHAIRDFGKIKPQETIRMEFGEPIFFQSNNTADLKLKHKKSIKFITDCHQKWQYL